MTPRNVSSVHKLRRTRLPIICLVYAAAVCVFHLVDLSFLDTRRSYYDVILTSDFDICLERITHRGGLGREGVGSAADFVQPLPSDRLGGNERKRLLERLLWRRGISSVDESKVNAYLRMARAEVHAFPPLSAETVRAWTILGYVHGFLGDEEEFSRCLKRADALMSACKENGSKKSFPVGLSEIIQWDKSMAMSGMSREDMQALSAEKIAPPEMSLYPSEAEVYRYMVAYNRAIVQVYARLSLSATEDAQRDVSGSDDFCTTELPPNESGVDEREEFRTEMIPIPPDVVWGKFKESSFELDMLEKAATHRLLSIAAAASYDSQGLFEKTRRVVDVFERYPGLFRFVHWLHASHYLASLLAGMEDSEARPLYDRLRAAYNPVQIACFRAIPPFEEWRGISSICDDPVCRMCEDYSERLPTPVPRELYQGAVQGDGSNAYGATSVELLPHSSVPTPEPSPLSPDEGIRFVPNGEEAGIKEIDVIATDGDIEIEMLWTLANAEPAALEEALFSQREELKLSLSKSRKQGRSPHSSLGVGTREDRDFIQVDSIDIGGKMGHEVSPPLGYNESDVVDAAEEENIGVEDWLEAITAIHSSPDHS